MPACSPNGFLARQTIPAWVIENGFGANSLWLTEWLGSVVELKPGALIRSKLFRGIFAVVVLPISFPDTDYIGRDTIRRRAVR